MAGSVPNQDSSEKNSWISSIVTKKNSHKIALDIQVFRVLVEYICPPCMHPCIHPYHSIPICIDFYVPFTLTCALHYIALQYLHHAYVYIDVHEVASLSLSPSPSRYKGMCVHIYIYIYIYVCLNLLTLSSSFLKRLLVFSGILGGLS